MRYTLVTREQRLAEAKAELARLGVAGIDVLSTGDTWLRFRSDDWSRQVRHAPAMAALRHLNPGVDERTVARVLSLVR